MYVNGMCAGTPAGKTPGLMGTAMSDTPLNLQNIDTAAIQRAAAGLPSSILNTLQQVAGQHTRFQTFQVHTSTSNRELDTVEWSRVSCSELITVNVWCM